VRRPARVVVTAAAHIGGRPAVSSSGLSGVCEPPMLVRMTTMSRPQRRYDHRLRDLVQRTRDLTIDTDLGVPRSTARGWLDGAPRVVVGLEVADFTEPELRQEILKLRRRVKRLTALLRLTLALIRSLKFTLTHERVPDGRDKIRIVRAVDRARACVPLRTLLQFLRLSPSRFHAWRRLQHACALDDRSSCLWLPRTSDMLRRLRLRVLSDSLQSWRPSSSRSFTPFASWSGRALHCTWKSSHFDTSSPS
jgi:hypothetical protein